MDPQEHGYAVVAFHPESKGTVIYIFLRDDSGKGIVLSKIYLHVYFIILPGTQIVGNALCSLFMHKD